MEMCAKERGESKKQTRAQDVAGQKIEYWDADAVGKDNGRGNGNSAKAKGPLAFGVRE